MSHVVTHPPDPFLAAQGRLRVHLVPAARDNLLWLIGPADGTEVIAVDGPGADELDAYCRAQGLRLSGVLVTHSHYDHLGLLKALRARGELAGLRVMGAAASGAELPGLNEPLEDGQPLSLFGVQGEALATEGHLRGHLCYHIGGLLLAGDTLFSGGCGRMFDGPASAFFASLRRLAALPPQTRLLCGHEYTQENLRFAAWLQPDDPALAARIREVWPRAARGECVALSDLKTERATNPFLRCEQPGPILDAVARIVGRPLQPGAELFAELRALKDASPHRGLSDTALLRAL